MELLLTKKDKGWGGQRISRCSDWCSGGLASGVGMGPVTVWEIRLVYKMLGLIWGYLQQWGKKCGMGWGIWGCRLDSIISCLIGIFLCHRGSGSPAVREFRLLQEGDHVLHRFVCACKGTMGCCIARHLGEICIEDKRGKKPPASDPIPAPLLDWQKSFRSSFPRTIL